jgi:chromosome partition protein MukE
MKAPLYRSLEEVINDSAFPDVDLALRAGRHIDIDDGEGFYFLVEAQVQLEQFYDRFGCDLVKTESFFYLLPHGDRLGQRHLTPGEMLVGQALALTYLDPGTVKASGLVTRTQLLELLTNLVGGERLTVALNPRRRRRHERVDEDVARREIDRSLRTLASLGFLDILGSDQLRLRAPLLRFTEAVRGAGDDAAALARLIARGEVAVATTDETDAEEGP